MPRSWHGSEPYNRELKSVWESDRTSDGAVLIPRELVTAIFGRVGTTEFGDGTLRVVRPNTDLKIDLGDVTHYFNDAYIKAVQSLAGSGTATRILWWRKRRRVSRL